MKTRAPGSHALALSLGVAAAACAPSLRPPPPEPTGAEWDVARASLAALRRTEPKAPYGVVVRVTLKEPRSGRSFVARGAVAVDPHRAVRMILLGPGGTTALDAWVTPEGFRLEVPPIGLLERGGERASRALPVAFFRWWFLDPVDGRLLTSYAGSELELPRLGPCRGRWFFLRRGPATVTMCDRDEGSELLATRRSGAALETLSFRGHGLEPHAGDRAVYEDLRSGVRADVEVESRDPDPPDPLAFVDPDRGGAR